MLSSRGGAGRAGRTSSAPVPASKPASRAFPSDCGSPGSRPCSAAADPIALAVAEGGVVNSTYQLSRSIPSDPQYDLVVAGGGPAGTAAAVCAARLGLKVLLVEATGCLGGMGTSGLVASVGPVSDGERMLVGSFVKELLATMWEQKAFGPQVTQEYRHSQLNRWVRQKGD